MTKCFPMVCIKLIKSFNLFSKTRSDILQGQAQKRKSEREQRERISVSLHTTSKTKLMISFDQGKVNALA